MGRNKLKIQKLETSSGRQVTYSKRRTGIMKKLRELSILCDCDALLLLFSTTGKPTLCLGENSKLEGVLKRYAEVCPQERLKKKLECLEALKKTFRGTDHTVDIEQLMNQSHTKPAEDLKKQIKIYQDQIAETLIFLGPLGDLDDIDNIESIDKIIALEKSLNALLGETKMQKDYVETMLANNFQFPPQGMNQGLPLDVNTGLPSQLSNIAGPSSQTLLPPLIVSPLNTGFCIKDSNFSNFDVPTGGVQFNGTGQGDHWFYMSKKTPQPLLPQQSFPLHQGDLTSTSNQGSTTNSDETDASNNNQSQIIPFQHGKNGLSSTEQPAEKNEFVMTPLDESILNENMTVDDFLNHSPLIFDQNYLAYDFKSLDFDSWNNSDDALNNHHHQSELMNGDLI